jgi:hypothetical protein
MSENRANEQDASLDADNACMDNMSNNSKRSVDERCEENKEGETKEHEESRKIVNVYETNKRKCSQQGREAEGQINPVLVSPGVEDGYRWKKTLIRNPSSKGLFKRAELFEHLASPKSFLSNPPEIMCRTLGGGIDLIWVDQGNTEAFINPFYTLYFPPPGVTIKSNERIEQLKKHTNIFACVARRVSKEINDAEYKFSKDNKKFKKSYFVRLKTKGAQEGKKLYEALTTLRKVKEKQHLCTLYCYDHDVSHMQ